MKTGEDRDELTNGEVINFKEIKKSKESVIIDKVIKKSELVQKKGRKFYVLTLDKSC